MEQFVLISPSDICGGIGIAFIFTEHRPFPFPFFKQGFSSL
jgi:hypothetical protein